MKRTAARLFLLLAVLITFALPAAAKGGSGAYLEPEGGYPKPTSDFFVNDFANVLSRETEEYMMAMSTSAQAEMDGMQIVVTTVESLGGLDVEEYALGMSREWGVGSGEKDNGLLILLSTGERKLRIEVGYGLEGEINDAKAGRLMDDYAIPYLEENDFDKGIRNLYQAVLSELGVSGEAPEAPEKDSEWAGIGIAVFLVIMLAVFFSGGGRGGGRRRRRFFYALGGSMNGSAFGSGFRGGSFRGGGGFSGRGGSFGGGGASRGF